MFPPSRLANLAAESAALPDQDLLMRTLKRTRQPRTIWTCNGCFALDIDDIAIEAIGVCQSQSAWYLAPTPSHFSRLEMDSFLHTYCAHNICSHTWLLVFLRVETGCSKKKRTREAAKLNVAQWNNSKKPAVKKRWAASIQIAPQMHGKCAAK